MKDLYSKDTYNRMSLLMERYTTDNLVNVKKSDFKSKLNQFMETCDYEMESYSSPDKQRDLSVKYHWGHNHDFGDFFLEGKMADRHLTIVSTFIDHFGLSETYFKNKKILDIGCWNGGTSLLFASMGASVLSIEEVNKYTETLKYLIYAFDIQNLEVMNKSLYDLNNYIEQFDIVFFSGVLYHLTDPILALRIIFNMLKNDGICLLESMVLNSDKSYFEYYGPNRFSKGSLKDLNRTGWNWMVPSPKAILQILEDVGFTKTQLSDIIHNRIFGLSTREEFSNICMSGLSNTSIEKMKNIQEI